MVVITKNDVFLTIRKNDYHRNKPIIHKIIIANTENKSKYVEHCDTVYKLGNLDENNYDEIIANFKKLKDYDDITPLTVADVLMDINGTLEQLTNTINSYIKCKRFSCYVIHAKARKNINKNTTGNRSLVFYGTIGSNGQTEDTIRKILNNIYNAGFNWYIYVSVDRRIISKAVERLQNKIDNALEAINYGDLDRVNMLKDMDRTWHEILMEKESSSYNKILIDLDMTDDKYYQRIIQFIDNFENAACIACHKTKNGYHFIIDTDNVDFSTQFNDYVKTNKLNASIHINRYLYTGVIKGSNLSFIHSAVKIK